jgi:hypothetical protein
MEDLSRYLKEFVDPTIREFEQNPRSVRHAFLAYVATFHSVDYLAYPRKAQALRQDWSKHSPEFALVDRIAHAFKHVVSGNAASPQKQPLRSADVVVRPPAFFGTLVLDLSRLDDAMGGVTLNNQPNIDLLEVVKRAAEFLRTLE